MSEHSHPTTIDAEGLGHDLEEPRKLAWVLVFESAVGTRSARLEQGDSLVVGREEGCDVALADPTLSRKHARLTALAEGVRVRDLGSRNGVSRGGQRLEVLVLAPGEHVALGEVVVTLQPAASSAAVALGVHSFAHTMATLERSVRYARSLRDPVSLLALRPLRHKQVRLDQYVEQVRGALREVDTVGRYSAHTALVVLPGSDPERAARVAEKLVAPAPGRGRLVCGVACYPAGAGSAGAMLEAALQSARRASAGEPICLARAPSRGDSGGLVLRSSAAMGALWALVERAASHSATVLVRGETGTGKELVARELHRLSARRHGPLISVNCAAIPDNLLESVLFGHVRGAFTGAERDHDGVFVQAHGGTLFLDEVGELSPRGQAVLLRALETGRVTPVGGARERTVDVRVIAATHRDLEGLCAANDFRADLLYRLNTVTLRVPPLRERISELRELVRHFLEQRGAAADIRVADDVWPQLEAHSWPGNVRELRNVIERALVVSENGVIRRCDLPEDLAGRAATDPSSAADLPESGLDLPEFLRAQEAHYIRAALRRTRGNRRKAAELLHIPLRTLERRIAAYRTCDP